MSKPPRSRRRKRPGKSPGAPLELVEEAFHLLRTAPLGTLWLFYLGAVPFVMAAFFFWADMSRSSYAAKDASIAALGVAVAYFWMKGWQGMFCRRLWSQLLPSGEMVPLTGLRSLRYFSAQVFLHSLSLPLLAGSMIFVGWVFAFFQNASALAFTRDFENKPLRKLIRESARLSHYGWGQNHFILLVMSGVGLFTWLNNAGSLALIPTAIKMFFGIESVFTLNPVATLLNTTFLFGSVLITFLVLDPLMKAIYVLRCFYGISRETGADLLSRLAAHKRNPDGTSGPSPLEKKSQKTLAASLIVSFLFLNISGHTRESDSPNPPTEEADASSLEASIQTVLQQKQYQWRLSRQQVGDAEDQENSWLANALTNLANSIERLVKKVGNSVERILEKIFNSNGSRDRGKKDSLTGETIGMIAKILMVALVAVLIIWLVIMLAKRSRGRKTDDLDHPLDAGPIDLESENIVASQLPEDEWMRLAREQIQKGEHRLAVRALFLASLAHLGERGLIRVARFKSNRDYTRELELKAHSRPELRSAFSENVGLFERAWYGLHQIGTEAIGRFTRNYEHITTQSPGGETDPPVTR